MSLVEEYAHQDRWRSWSELFGALPSVAGKTVVDLGCGIGAQAAELVSRGARVIGIDMNEELLQAARARNLPGAEFHRGDLNAPPALGPVADGLWCSFACAYLPDLASALCRWRELLKPGGWIALIEIDDLFGHEPLSASVRSLLDAHARNALSLGHYDFHMGSKLPTHLQRAGFTLKRAFTVADRELAFEGPAAPEVLAAWRKRLERMASLQSSCGEDVERVRKELLASLARADHRSRARVCCCIATR